MTGRAKRRRGRRRRKEEEKGEEEKSNQSILKGGEKQQTEQLSEDHQHNGMQQLCDLLQGDLANCQLPTPART